MSPARFRELHPGRRRARSAPVVLVLASITVFLLMSGCSLLVDTSGLSDPCEAGFKYCKDIQACVSQSDPGFGCGRLSCEPCSNNENQLMGCNNVADCVVVGCVEPCAEF